MKTSGQRYLQWFWIESAFFMLSEYASKDEAHLQYEMFLLAFLTSLYSLAYASVIFQASAISRFLSTELPLGANR